MVTIRLAQEQDNPSLWAMDHIAGVDAERRALIAKAVHLGECYVAEDDGVICGYAMMNYHFFANGFVELLYTHPDHRRKGVGAALMTHLADICRTEKLFTSTNLSNLPMQSLLARLGYHLSGVVHDLDEGDPELFYVKVVR